jgi:hypothetical protein
MAANYPSTIANSVRLPARTDNVDVVIARDVNNVYEEVIATQTAVGALPADYAPRSEGYTTSVSTFSSLSARVGNLEKGFVTRVVDTVGGTTIQSIAGTSTASPLTIKQYTDSATNLLEFKSSDGTVINAVSSAGNLSKIDGGGA